MISMNTYRFTALLEREDNMYVSLCPELDIASQGTTVEEAKNNLQEAVKLFLETASESEIKRRLHSEIFISQFEIVHG